MKRMVYSFSALLLAAGMIVASCSSNETAEERMDRMGNSVDNTANNISDWIEFRKAAKAEIAANRQKIAELRVKQEKQGDLGDKISEERIEMLEAENERLQEKMNKYDPKREADGKRWDEFKREFRHDMDELGKSIGDLGRDNAK